MHAFSEREKPASLFAVPIACSIQSIQFGHSIRGERFVSLVHFSVTFTHSIQHSIRRACVCRCAKCASNRSQSKEKNAEETQPKELFIFMSVCVFSYVYILGAVQ